MLVPRLPLAWEEPPLVRRLLLFVAFLPRLILRSIGGVCRKKDREKQGLEKQLPTERYNTKIYVEKEEEKRKFNKMNSSWVLLPNISV